jgi:hypothetical protein
MADQLNLAPLDAAAVMAEYGYSDSDVDDSDRLIGGAVVALRGCAIKLSSAVLFEVLTPNLIYFCF